MTSSKIPQRGMTRELKLSVTTNGKAKQANLVLFLSWSHFTEKPFPVFPQ